jgi:hypothetical protein
MDGWIKLHRKSIESAVFQNPNLWKAWCWCLMRANHKENKFLFGGEEIHINSGQFITGRFEGAEQCGMKPSTFRDQLRKLKALGNIDTTSDNKKTLITVINWGHYQYQDSESDTTSDTYPTTNRQQTDTDKNDRMKESLLNLFDYWNNKEIIQHRTITDKLKRKLNGSLRDYSTDEIKSAIDNYSFILNSEDYFFNYKWTLHDFLQRGLEKFIDLEVAKNNYRKSNNGHKPKEETLELNA